MHSRENLLLTARNFRNILNDLKRRPVDAAHELGVREEEIESLLAGERPLPEELIAKCCAIWPVSPRDFQLINDDAPRGALIMTAQESEQSARVMQRRGVDYYEYRDTAASKVASFRPEWIRELCTVENDDVDHPALSWNNGHLLHQFTYFVGPVNFYYLDRDGRKQVAVMSTGDSMYISPFTPHTFATRSSDGGGGIILALTYGNALQGDALQELRALGEESLAFSLDMSSRGAATASLIRYHQKGCSMGDETLQNFTALPDGRLQQVLAGTMPTFSELETIARALAVGVRDLLAWDGDSPNVTVLKSAEARSWDFPSAEPRYRMRELAHHTLLPRSKALEITLFGSPVRSLDLEVGLHQYLYCLEGDDVSMSWKTAGVEHAQRLQPGDSAYLKPFLPHAFEGKGKILSLRIPSRVPMQTIFEMSFLGRDYARKAIDETGQWFNA